MPLQVLKQVIPNLAAYDVSDDNGVVLWPSMTQNAYQTAELIAYELGIGRNRIVPEYSFLDKRGVGALEGSTLDNTDAQISAGDATDPNWRPLKGPQPPKLQLVLQPPSHYAPTKRHCCAAVHCSLPLFSC